MRGRSSTHLLSQPLRVKGLESRPHSLRLSILGYSACRWSLRWLSWEGLVKGTYWFIWLGWPAVAQRCPSLGKLTGLWRSEMGRLASSGDSDCTGCPVPLPPGPAS